MKKYLLLFILINFINISFAQTIQRSCSDLGKVRSEVKTNQHYVPQPNAVKLSKNASDIESVERITVAKSGNAYSILHSEQRYLFYDEYTEKLLFTHSADDSHYQDALSNQSVISTTFAKNIDSDWDSDFQISLNTPNGVHSNSNPSGILYNPNQENDISNIYSVIAGPDFANAVENNNYFASAKMDNSNLNNEYKPWVGENDWARSCMTVINDEVFIFGQDYENIGDYGAHQTMKHYKGTSDDPANGFDWEINALSPDWLINEEEDYNYALYTTWSAWKKDGSIGYMWMIGVTNESQEYGVYQPQVYVTNDGGDSWEYIELNFEDNPTLLEFLTPWEDENGEPQTVRPSFLTEDRAFPGLVDVFGNLHLMANVYSSTTGSVLNEDEANGVSINAKGGHLFHIIINEQGIDEIVFLDSIRTNVKADSAYGHLGMDHRFHIAKDPEETIIAFVWGDEDNSEDGVLNLPDIKAVITCAGTGVYNHAVNYTEDDLYAGFYFYSTVSEYLVPKQMGSLYTIPLVTSVKPHEFGANDPNEPISHDYVQGLDFEVPHWCLWGVEKKEYTASMEVNFVPNPVVSHARLSVYTKVIGNAYLNIQNTQGQQLLQKDLGMIYQQDELDIDLSMLTAGIYFYTVKIGDEQASGKLVVQ